MSSKCAVCQKSVYPNDKKFSMDSHVYHAGCFKCSGLNEDGSQCGLRLTLTTAKSYNGIVFCAKHEPKAKPTSVTVDGSMALSNAKNAPKRDLVNTNKRGDDMESNTGGLTFAQSSQVEAKKMSQTLVNTQVRNVEAGDQGSLSFAETSQKKAADQHSKVINEQVRNVEAGHQGSLSYAETSQKKAASQHDRTINEQVRGESTNSQVADMATSNALKAPKNSVVNEQVRGESQNSQVADMATTNAVKAPKASDPVNEQIRGAQQ